MFARYGTTNSEKAIITYPRNVRVPYHVPLSGKYISPNKEGRRSAVEGHFVSKKNGEHRLLPRAKVVALPAGNRLKVSSPYIFVPGDVLMILNPTTTLTITGVGQAGVMINNQTFTYTPVGAANATEAGTMIAKYFNSLPSLNQNLEFVAEGTSLYVYSPIGKEVVTVTPSGTLGTTAVTTVPITAPIGTIQAIDIETEEFILAAPVSGTLPVGSVIGVPQDEVLGIYPHSVDFTAGGILGQNVGIVEEAKVYKLHLPHYDTSLMFECPNIEAREVWS